MIDKQTDRQTDEQTSLMLELMTQTFITLLSPLESPNRMAIEAAQSDSQIKSLGVTTKEANISHFGGGLATSSALVRPRIGAQMIE